jgi:hypothetical protein
MTIWIVQNAGASRVVADLRQICGNDPGLVVDFNGKVSFSPTTSSVGAVALARLTRPGQIVPISIRVEAPTYTLFNTTPPGLPRLLFCAATLTTNQPGFVSHVEVLYDTTEGLSGLGYFVYDANSRKIPVPTDVALFHELAHARIFLDGETDRAREEVHAINAENDYRVSHGLHQRFGHWGGLYGDPDRTKAPPFGSVPQRRSPDRVIPGVVMLCSPYFEDDLGPPTILAPGQAMYLVYVRNLTPDTFSEIVVFYKRIGQTGVVYLREENVRPAEYRAFALGLSEVMESYVIGFFQGDQLVAQLPRADEGNMTPVRASLENPDDKDPAADWWTIEPG